MAGRCACFVDDLKAFHALCPPSILRSTGKAPRASVIEHWHAPSHAATRCK